MSDIFREVEEDVRRERFEKLWKQYGDYIIAGVAVLVIAVAGYQFWLRYETQQRQNASVAYDAALQLVDSGDSAGAALAFAKLAKDGPGGYATLARLAQADSLFASGNHSDAIEIYQSIANKDKSQIGSVALVRAAWAKVEFTPKSQLETLLSPLTDPTSPWRFMAREILAYSDFHAGNFKDSQKEYADIAADKEAPEPIRSRCNVMAVFLKTGGDNNAGTVPRPAPLLGPASDQKGLPPQ